MEKMQEMRVQFLCQEDLMEEEMATHSRILVGIIPWAEKPGGYSPWGLKELDMSEGLSTHTHTEAEVDVFSGIPSHSL